MKLTTTKKELTKAIAAARKVVDRRSTLPILECVVIKAVKKEATFHVNDLETALTIPLVTHKDNVASTVVVNLVALGKAVKAMKGDVALCLKEDKLIVSSGSLETAISTQEIDDFPTPPIWPKKADTNETSAAGLHTALQKVSYAMSSDETRFNLCGVYIERDGRSASKVVAANGHILGKTELSFKGKSFKAIIPSKAVIALVHLLKIAEGQITIAIDKNRMHLHFDGTEMFIRLVDGEFPSWQQTIPKHNANSITFERAALQEAVQSIQALSTENNPLMAMTYPNGDGKECKFSLTDIDGVVSAVKLDCDNINQIEEAPEQMGINVNYLATMLRQCEEQSVTLNYGGELDPIIIEEGSNQHLIMPMRL